MEGSRVPDRTPTHRYRSPTYSRSGAATRRRRGRRRLAALLATLVLLAVGGVTAWAFVGDRQAGTTTADTTSGAAQGGDGPDTAAIVEPVASPSPSPDTAESAGSSGSGASSPAPSPDGSAGTFTGTYVPILMYHRIEETSDTSTNAKYYTSPKKFRQQMRALYLEGYTAVTLQQVWDYWHDEGTLPAKPIVLTFDDGTSGQAENTLPVLEKYGWPGVISVVVPNVSDAGGSLSISPDQIRRLLDAGWELDSHSMTHPMLNTVSADRLAYELGESRRRLQEQFGVPCNFFCYPGGEHNATVMSAAEAAGYIGATTVVRGCADPATPYALDRIEVDGRNVIKTFLRDLEYWEAHP
jgi:peptidoglycan/xylan/chitin deacetylase (PgdA/CDA1 family)